MMVMIDTCDKDDDGADIANDVNPLSPNSDKPKRVIFVRSK